MAWPMACPARGARVWPAWTPFLHSASSASSVSDPGPIVQPPQRAPEDRRSKGSARRSIQLTAKFPRQETSRPHQSIRRASSSICANVEEDCGRHGDGNGSAGELESHLLRTRNSRFAELCARRNEAGCGHSTAHRPRMLPPGSRGYRKVTGAVLQFWLPWHPEASIK
jgi:four helix bundle protein